MAARGGQRKPRQQRPRPQPVEQVIDLRETLGRHFAETVDAAASAAPVRVGATVLLRINSLGRDEHRPAIVIRDDGHGLATLFVFTLPGDEIAAGARVSMQRAVGRPRGDGVGEWQPLSAA